MHSLTHVNFIPSTEIEEGGGESAGDIFQLGGGGYDCMMLHQLIISSSGSLG